MAANLSRTRWLLRTLLVLILGLGFAAPGWANAPLSGQHYPNGAEDFVVGALPPPGVYLKTYTTLIQKDRYMGPLPDVPGMPFVDGVGDSDKNPLDFKADVTVVLPRFIWVTPLSIFGASYATQVFLPLYWADVQSEALGIDDRSAGMGDIIFTPAALGWHFGPSFHVIAAVDLFLPTGDYRADDYSTQILSKNSWTIEPVVALTYLRGPWDFSAKFMYDFNTTNDDYVLGPFTGDLKPGQEFHVDWAVGFAPKQGLRFGLAGYSYWQVTKDELVPDGGGDSIKVNKGVVHAVGPAIKYWPNQGRFSATLKYNWEFGAKNLPEGQAAWLNGVWVF